MYKPGTQNISNQQQQLLATARKVKAADEWHKIRDILEQIATDGDISSGREELHPAWLEIIEFNRDRLEQFAPKATLDHILTLQRTLQAPGINLRQFEPSRLKITFLLGAGASQPAPSSIPTVKALLTHLFERARRLDREDLSRLEYFCRSNRITNIEDLLTATQLATFCSRSPNVLGLIDHLIYKSDAKGSDRSDSVRARNRADLSSVSFLQDTLQVLFGLLSNMMLPAKPNAAHKAIATYAAANSSCSIVTTNYDCCIDLALGKFGDDFHYSSKFTDPSGIEVAPSSSYGTPLIKLHGSLNWYYCDACQEIKLKEATKVVSGFLSDDVPYSIINICKVCGGQQRTLLVPPSLITFDIGAPLTFLLENARIAFLGADLIVAVGFSFADADAYIFRLVSKAMQVSPSRTLLIFDVDPRLSGRVRRRLSASIPDFVPARVVDVTGDCADLLPKFLSGEYCEVVAEETVGVVSKSKRTALKVLKKRVVRRR